MTEVLTPDVCVIGGGRAGVAACLSAKAAGAAVVLVEQGAIGGRHLHSTLPLRGLSASASRVEQARNAKAFGINLQRPKVDFYEVHNHVQQVIGAAAPNYAATRLRGLGIEVVTATARFTEPAKVMAGDVAIKARRFIIATGCVPAAPPSGLADAPHFTEQTIFELLACPKHLAVLGAGPTGLEFAQAFRRLGADVTVLDSGPPLPAYDDECAGIVREQLEREGIAIRAGVRLSQIKQARSKVKIVIGEGANEETIEATHLLVTGAGAPNLESLDLDAAGIKRNAHALVLDQRLRTTNRKVFAVGSVAGLRGQQVDAAVRNALASWPAKIAADAVPQVTFTEPELAQVGLTEAQVRERSIAMEVLRWPLWENDRARAEKDQTGHIKVIASRSGRILGATIVGSQAGEMIGTWSLAVSQHMNIAAVADLPLAIPTRSEIGKQAAAMRSGLAASVIRRMMTAGSGRG